MRMQRGQTPKYMETSVSMKNACALNAWQEKELRQKLDAMDLMHRQEAQELNKYRQSLNTMSHSMQTFLREGTHYWTNYVSPNWPWDSIPPPKFVVDSPGVTDRYGTGGLGGGVRISVPITKKKKKNTAAQKRVEQRKASLPMIAPNPAALAAAQKAAGNGGGDIVVADPTAGMRMTFTAPTPSLPRMHSRGQTLNTPKTIGAIPPQGDGSTIYMVPEDEEVDMQGQGKKPAAKAKDPLSKLRFLQERWTKKEASDRDSTEDDAESIGAKTTRTTRTTKSQLRQKMRLEYEARVKARRQKSENSEDEEAEAAAEFVTEYKTLMNCRYLRHPPTSVPKHYTILGVKIQCAAY
ncbi:uncharacterized protein [Branchiostoma lanceolatum]|uniref:uncharacterized protein n=1 Tax=Branchiostoma lanceolatum TaxID=7740 RepID=UPI003451CF84